MATALKYLPLKKPAVPGFYFIAEKGEPIFRVQVCVENDSYALFYVLIPEDGDYKYDLEMWAGALWFGPLEEKDFDLFED